MSQIPPHNQSYPPQHGKAPGIALAALICGILGMGCFPLALLALILGLIALNKISDNRPGRGFAIAGVALGGSGMLVSILVFFIMLGILLPAIGADRRTAQRMQNSTQLRGIHQGMMSYANNNKNIYPGLDAKSQILADGALTGNSGDGNTPMARYWILFDGDYIIPDYAISPSETQAIFAYPGSGPVQPDHYSYAMLGFETTGGITPQNTYGIEPDTRPRAEAWTNNVNSQAIVISDRNIGSDTNFGIQSVHSDSPGQWRGSVLWNDNHVAFENAHLFETKYGSGSLNLQDHLFEQDTATGHDALMVHD